jgi:hypothetical protein
MEKEREKKFDYLGSLIFFAKFLSLIILCFLPSFIFTALFVQYGSPFENYFRFLFNIESSFIAWLSAIAIFILFSISKRIVNSRKNFNIIKNKFPFSILVLCFIAIISLISVQSYLYANFLLGSDILVKLSSTNDNIFFNDNSNQNVTFKISVTTAPFCSVECSYKFFDISKGVEIESGAFNLTTSFSKLKQYNLSNENLIFGTQVLKRFEVSCKNKKALFCRTKEKESTRAILLTLNYNVSRGDYHLSPSCCYMGNCKQCCYYSCSEKNYPVIFLHGHSINKELPADYSLDVFNEIKQKLSKEGYIDAGAVIISSSSEVNGLWGKVDVPVLVTASYFFDTYKTKDGEVINSSTGESIDTYAERLNRIVKIIKARTGKDKVIIVSHSMGGLVTRDYLDIYGKTDVDKVILVTSPNHGVDDKVRDYCSVFGSKEPCAEMDKDGLFIKRINMNSKAIVPTYNIIGIGCNMGNETGDGIIKSSSQYLPYATNYYVKGTCDELNFDYLHGDIIFPDKYPEAYDIIKSILENQKL